MYVYTYIYHIHMNKAKMPFGAAIDGAGSSNRDEHISICTKINIYMYVYTQMFVNIFI
jgi:hypothetical protein